MRWWCRGRIRAPVCYTFGSMADNETFIPAPAGLTVTLKDGTRAPIVAFRVSGHDLVPHYIETDGSGGWITAGGVEGKVAAAWMEPPQ